MSRSLLSRLQLLCLLFFVASSIANTQSLSEIHWYFGNSTEGIRFNKSDQEPGIINNQLPLGTGGSAVATDQVTGNLLFYTDGNLIVDASHQIMANINGVSDHNQSAALAPVPGDSAKYFVFYKNTGGGILYTIVDMTLPGNSNDPTVPLGDVIVGSVSTPTGITAISSSAMIVVSGGMDPINYYLIVQEGNEYKSYQINAGPAFTEVSAIAVPNGLIAANFAFNKNAGKIAVAPKNASKNVQILNFAGTSGTLTFNTEIFNTGNADDADPAVFDTEWSEDGDQLFISRHGAGTGNTGQLYLYYSDTVAPQRILPEPIYRSYGLKRGPDNKIYHLYQETNGGPYLIGRISSPDSLTSQLDYESLAFDNTDFNGLQFPEFLPDIDITFDIDFDVIDACANGRTKFIPLVDPPAEDFTWTINDTTINAISPELTFEQAGTYSVTLKVEINGKVDSINRPIQIFENELEINLPSDTTVCATAFPGLQLEATVSPENSQVQLTWSNGQTGPTATFDSTGYYYVVAENTMNGCQVYAGVNIKICQEEKSRANIWYFGEQAGLDFNDYDMEDEVFPPIAITDDNQMQAPAGASAISDRNGKILFYTNGQTVWNRNHEVMLNGDDIGGDPQSAQSAIIVPFPGDETLYYIFTTTRAPEYQVNYSVVDIKGDEGNGEVEIVPTTSEAFTSLFSRSTEKITAIASGDKTWVLIHELGNNTFRAYPVTNGGIGIPELSSVGSDYTSAGGYMKFSTNGQKVASAIQGPPGFVEIYSFSDSTGTLDDSVRFDFNGEQPYGVEFSPNTDALYVTTNTGLYQFFVNDTLTAKEMQDSKELIQAGNGFGALQTGPNGQIYMAVNNSSSIKFISSPNVLQTDTSRVQVSDFLLDGRTSNLGLPNFIQSLMEPIQEAGFEVANGCLGDSTLFSATGRCDTDIFNWNFGDGNMATGEEVNHQYATAGEYLVTLTISNPCAIPADTTIVDTVLISAPPAATDFPEFYGLCGNGDSLQVYEDPAPGLSFQWSNGLTGNTIPVNRPGDYSVVVTNEAGCSVTENFTAQDARPRLDLGPDQILCEGDETDPLNARNTGADFDWTVLKDNNNFQTGSNQRQEVYTDQPGEYLYIVTVTEPEGFGGCQKTDSIFVTVNATPDVEGEGFPTSDCGIDDGSIELTFNSSGDYSYTLNKDGGTVATGSSPLLTNPVLIGNLAPGIYTAVITDNVTGCQETLNIGVEDASLLFTIEDYVAICSGSGSITVNLNNNSAFPLTYVLYDENGDPVLSNTNITADATDPNSFTITGPPAISAGTYSLEVTAQNGTGCVQTLTGIEIEEVDLSVEFEDGCEQATASATSTTGNNVSFLWLNENGTTQGITGVNDQPEIGFNQSGTYVVTASAPGYCDVTETIDILISDAPELTINVAGDACSGQLTLSADIADGSGDYAYLWGGGQTTQNITVNLSGDYTVDIRDRGTGCISSDTISVEVFNPLEVLLTADPACENEGATVIRAIPATNDTTGLIFTWFGNNQLIQGENSDTLVVTDNGQYRLVLSQEGNDCPAQDDITINFDSVGLSTLPTEVQIICISDPDPELNSVLLNPDSLNSFAFYSWELDGELLSSEKTVLAGRPGVYSVTMSTPAGCTVTGQVEVIEDCQPQVFIPNAFRPNSSIPDNQVFQVFNKEEIDPDGFQVFIFNRWGELIFQSPDKNFKWDGTFKGEPVPTGSYAYVIRYTGIFDPNEEVVEKRGGVMVIR